MERYLRLGGRILAVSHVRSPKEKREGKNTQSRCTQHTLRSAQQHGDRDRLETACDETRPNIQPLVAIDPGLSRSASYSSGNQ